MVSYEETVFLDGRARRVYSEVLNMTAKWKWVLWITGALLLAIVASAVFIGNRGGHYPAYKASSFPHLALPITRMASTGAPEVQIGAGTLRGTQAGSVIAFRGIPSARH